MHMRFPRKEDSRGPECWLPKGRGADRTLGTRTWRGRHGSSDGTKAEASFIHCCILPNCGMEVVVSPTAFLGWMSPEVRKMLRPSYVQTVWL